LVAILALLTKCMRNMRKAAGAQIPAMGDMVPVYQFVESQSLERLEGEWM
jgi:hypothetical protein